MSPKIKTQINNRLESLRHRPVEQGYGYGGRVWYVPCARNERGEHRYTLSNGTPCWDWWWTLADAHRALFADQNIRADNYNY